MAKDMYGKPPPPVSTRPAFSTSSIPSIFSPSPRSTNNHGADSGWYDAWTGSASPQKTKSSPAPSPSGPTRKPGGW